MKENNKIEYEELLNSTLTCLQIFLNRPIKNGEKIQDEDIILNKAIERINKEKDRINDYWFLDDSRANNQYKNYAINRINNAIQTCRSILKYAHNQYYRTNVVGYAREIIQIIGDNSSNELYDNFKYGDCNYVLFGKNGAGKTTLINELSSRMLSSNSVVVPATRNINYSKDVMYRDSDANLQNALKSNDSKALFYFSKMIIRQDYAYRKASNEDETSILETAINTFNSLGLDRKLSIDEIGELYLTLEDASGKYSFSQASDGEKSSLFFIFVTLLSPKESFLIIDEPENHLNGSLMQKLFDALEDLRKDLIFVYATHNISFIETRNNIEIVYLKKNNKKDHWEFNKFVDYKNLPLDTILAVEGTNEDVVFCEGEDSNSLDCKLYRTLFSNKQIVPSNGCDKVIAETIIFNENASVLRKKAFGIIDNDFREEKNINDLREKGIFVLKLNEVENLLISDCCLKGMKDYLSIDNSLEDIKRKIIEHIKYKKDDILKDYATKSIKQIHFKNKIEDIQNIEKSIDQLNETNKKNFMESFGSFANRFETAINDLNYDDLMVLIPGKMLIKCVSKILGLSDDETYVRLCLKQIEASNSLQDALKEYICNDL